MWDLKNNATFAILFQKTIVMVVTARIDVTKPAGRRLVQDLGTKKYVQIEELLGTEKSQNGIPWREVYERGLDKLSTHYGVDMRELKSKLGQN